MLAIYLYREGERTQRITSTKDEIWLGTHAEADVPVHGKGVVDRHCKLVVRPAGCFLVEEAGQVRINGKAIAKATPLYETDKVFLGAYSFMIETLERAPDPTEEKLLADIAAGDDDSRVVYADWLEENGDIRRAEFLRVQEALRALTAHDADTRVAFVEQSRRLQHLALLVDLAWRMKVVRAPVEGCKVARFDLPCTQQWSGLAETGFPDVRLCTLCHQEVYYSTTLAEARSHAWRGRCVAVDLANERSRGDLDRTQPVPRMIAPE